MAKRLHVAGLARRIRFACFGAWLGALALPAVVGCSYSPRGEYLHTRTIEVTPTDQGDGTTLAQRDEILRASMAGVAVGPVMPLAAAKSEVEENRQ